MAHPLRRMDSTQPATTASSGWWAERAYSRVSLSRSVCGVWKTL